MTPRGYNQTRAGLVGGGLPDPRAPPKTEDLGLAGVDDVFVPVCTIGQLYSYCMNLDIIMTILSRFWKTQYRFR